MFLSQISDFVQVTKCHLNSLLPFFVTFLQNHLAASFTGGPSSLKLNHSKTDNFGRPNTVGYIPGPSSGHKRKNPESREANTFTFAPEHLASYHSNKNSNMASGNASAKLCPPCTPEKRVKTNQLLGGFSTSGGFSTPGASSTAGLLLGVGGSGSGGGNVAPNFGQYSSPQLKLETPPLSAKYKSKRIPGNLVINEQSLVSTKFNENK